MAKKETKPVIERHVRRDRSRAIITILYAALYIKVRSISSETVIAINVRGQRVGSFAFEE